jgi:hypothetical protein
VFLPLKSPALSTRSRVQQAKQPPTPARRALPQSMRPARIPPTAPPTSTACAPPAKQMWSRIFRPADSIRFFAN